MADLAELIEKVKGAKVLINGERQRYTVMAVSDRYAIMTKPFNARRTYIYTIADRKRGVRGPCNLIFGPPSDLNTGEGATVAMAMLTNGEMDISYRNFVPLHPSEEAQIWPSAILTAKQEASNG